MKGRLRPYLPELTIRDYNTYLRYLRGVRWQLYKSYGFFIPVIFCGTTACCLPSCPTAWRGARQPVSSGAFPERSAGAL